jgi:hypothetical protein
MWQEYINQMFAEAEAHGIKVRGFYASGGSGAILQAEGYAEAINWDTVSGDYVKGSEFIKDSPDHETWQGLITRINAQGEWVEEPLFWASEESPEDWVS